MSATSHAELARISGALVAALGEAQQMVRSHNIGSEFAALLQHARDLYTLLDEGLATAGDAVTPEGRAVAAKMGDAFAHLEQEFRASDSMH